MATYPNYKIHESSSISRLSGLKVDRGGDGSLWVRKMYPAPKIDFTIVHASLSQDDYDALLTFYSANVGIAFDFIYCGVTHTNCFFVDVPQQGKRNSYRRYPVTVKKKKK